MFGEAGTRSRSKFCCKSHSAADVTVQIFAACRFKHSFSLSDWLGATLGKLVLTMDSQVALDEVHSSGVDNHGRGETFQISHQVPCFPSLFSQLKHILKVIISLLWM